MKISPDLPVIDRKQSEPVLPALFLISSVVRHRNIIPGKDWRQVKLGLVNYLRCIKIFYLSLDACSYSVLESTPDTRFCGVVAQEFHGFDVAAEDNHDEFFEEYFRS